MTEQMKDMTRRLYEAMGKGDLAVVEELISEDAVDHETPPGMPPGREGVLVFIGMMRGAFPDARFNVEDLIAEGDKVVARVTMTGTHRGDFMGIPATGKQVNFSVIDVIRFENGKMVEHWGQDDQLGLMQQLGVIPAPDQVPA